MSFGNGQSPRGTDELDHLLREVFDAEYSIRLASRAVPAEFRPQWRIPVLLLILRRCRGEKATWKQLHVMNWAVRSPATRSAFAALAAGELGPDQVIVRYEPTLSRVVDLAVGLGLASWEHGRLLALTDQGKNAIAAADESEALAAEREFLASIPGALTQQRINAALQG